MTQHTVLLIVHVRAKFARWCLNIILIILRGCCRLTHHTSVIQNHSENQVIVRSSVYLPKTRWEWLFFGPKDFLLRRTTIFSPRNMLFFLLHNLIWGSENVLFSFNVFWKSLTIAVSWRRRTAAAYHISTLTLQDYILRRMGSGELWGSNSAKRAFNCSTLASLSAASRRCLSI